VVFTYVPFHSLFVLGQGTNIQNGKSFTTVEVKPEMTGHYLGEFSITYKPVGHGRGANMKDSRLLVLSLHVLINADKQRSPQVNRIEGFGSSLYDVVHAHSMIVTMGWLWALGADSVDSDSPRASYPACRF
jgi:hypothetical protein